MHSYQAKISPAKNFFGQEWKVFLSSNGKDRKLKHSVLKMFSPEDYSFVFSSIEDSEKSNKISKAAEWTILWLKFKSLCNESGSVVFDIDDTLVDGSEKKIVSICRVYKIAQKLGFVCNIITARPESKENRSYTKKMLASHGLSDYEVLYMMPSKTEPTMENISFYKYNARMHVAQRHAILCNLGDMWTDHIKMPCAHKELRNRDVAECAILFVPGTNYPSIKLPGVY